jgi:hypothetical protein
LLAEVPLPVEETDGDEGHAEIGRGLQVIAGEHPEAARVDRQALVEPELAREVGDAEALVLAALLPPGGALELEPEGTEDAFHALRVLRCQHAREVVVGHLGEERHGVVVERLEALRAQLREEAAGAGDPAEGDVRSDRAEGFAERFGAVEHVDGPTSGSGDSSIDLRQASWPGRRPRHTSRSAFAGTGRSRSPDPREPCRLPCRLRGRPRAGVLALSESRRALIGSLATGLPNA